jgi:diguanylate cyclase (GGDEF)-like protein
VKGSSNLLFHPIEFSYWAGILGIRALGWLLPMSRDEIYHLNLFTVAASLFTLAFFHWLIPRYGSRPWVNWLGAYGSVFLLASITPLLERYDIHSEILYMGVVASLGMRGGRRPARIAAGVAASTEVVTRILIDSISALNYPALVVNAAFILLVGFLVSELGNALYVAATEQERRNRHLSVLLKVGMLASQPQPLGETLSQIAEIIARDAPVTVCRILLLDAQEQNLITYGVYPLRPFKDAATSLESNFALNDLPEVQKILSQGEHRLFHQEEIAHLILDAKRTAFYFGGMNQICIFPLITKQKRLGVIVVGEARRIEREPCTQAKIDLMNALAAHVSQTIYNSLLFEDAQRQVGRMEMLNKVARAIGSTIEMDDLLELIYQQLSAAIPCDTYFVGLYDPEENVHDVRILVDEGVRFPPARVPVGSGLASWVLKNRQPLLVRHLSLESDRLLVQPIQVGQNRMSESWLGAPIAAGERYLGLLALASYTPNVFSEDDQSLLVSMASQAALALDNARQHAEVKEQARRDSLTGAYNHGYFLTLLSRSLEECRTQNAPLSLIMMDVDFFKYYNDLYGHLVGDEALRLLSQVVLCSLPKKAFLGRWGGEEFAIGLPGAAAEEAKELAQHIQTSLAQAELKIKNDERLANPTVSQGIAAFPLHADQADELVDSADRALYVAKSNGRNQIAVAP